MPPIIVIMTVTMELQELASVGVAIMARAAVRFVTVVVAVAILTIKCSTYSSVMMKDSL